MTDSCDPFDRHGNRRDSKKYYPDYRTRVCLTCGSEIYAPASRIGHVLSMHIDRCATATAEERLVFRRLHRWPKKLKEK